MQLVQRDSSQLLGKSLTKILVARRRPLVLTNTQIGLVAYGGMIAAFSRHHAGFHAWEVTQEDEFTALYVPLPSTTIHPLSLSCSLLEAFLT